MEVGGNATFDCVGEDNGPTNRVFYQWSFLNSEGSTAFSNMRMGLSNPSSLTLSNVQFTDTVGVRCIFGVDQPGSSNINSDNSQLILVGS